MCSWQAHIVLLKTRDENRVALLVGLGYLLNIDFVGVLKMQMPVGHVLEGSMLSSEVCLQAHIVSLETTDENRAALLMGLDYLLKISFVEDDEVFKICLDYWNYFVPDVYSRCSSRFSLVHGSEHSQVQRLAPLMTGSQESNGCGICFLRIRLQAACLQSLEQSSYPLCCMLCVTGRKWSPRPRICACLVHIHGQVLQSLRMHP